jgi:hypothetical protein
LLHVVSIGLPSVPPLPPIIGEPPPPIPMIGLPPVLVLAPLPFPSGPFLPPPPAEHAAATALLTRIAAIPRARLNPHRMLDAVA